MLQPLQLEDVSVRYPREIAELRDFLGKAGCAVGTPETLSAIAARLPRDRAFHRDLTSHIWVVIDRCNRQITYSELLGILALAAAGTTLAAAAEEDDAHHLLRFLMQARRSLETVPDDRDAAPLRGTAQPTANLPPRPFQPPRNDGPAPVRRHGQPLQREAKLTQVPPEIDRDGRRVRWAVAAACVMAALPIALWLKPWSTADAGHTRASVTPAAAANTSSPPVTGSSVIPPNVRPGDAASSPVMPYPTARNNSRVMPSRPTQRLSRQTLAAASSLPPRAGDTQPRAMANATHVPTPARQAAPPPAVATARVAGTAAINLPVAPLGGRSAIASSRPATLEQGSDTPSVRTSKPPIRLRRRPPGSFSAGSAGSPGSQDEPDLVAEVRPADLPATPGTTRPPVSDATRAGIVRLTSLGIMAGNIMYSPLPAYPAAASASHVQGEVKLSAEVDRGGNVASVRVISGPPLLRDAALDAVQRWRYRPYTSDGEPTSMTAVSIMDFQLP